MILLVHNHRRLQGEIPMNYYQILGINENATVEEIGQAYRNMIKAFHPDYYRGSNKEFAEEKTKELNEAYEVLKDPDSKAAYDRFLKAQSGDDISYEKKEERKETEDDPHKYDDVYAQINDMVEEECMRACYTSFPEDISGAICTVAYKAVCDIYSRTHNAKNYCTEWLRDYMKSQGMPDDVLEQYISAFGTVFFPELISKNNAFTWDFRGLSGDELYISLMARAVASFRSVGLDIYEKIDSLETRESLQRLIAGKYDKFNILESAINELYKFYLSAYNKDDWAAVREAEKPERDTTSYNKETSVDPKASAPSHADKRESYASGLLGAFVCALGGGIVWGVLYYFGYLSAIGGILTIALAGFGYKKFGHVDYLDTPRKVICFVITVIVSALAIYLTFGVAVYNAYLEQFNAGSVSSVPSLFEIWTIYLPYMLQTDTETLQACLLDLGKGLGLSAIYLIGWFFVE